MQARLHKYITVPDAAVTVVAIVVVPLLPASLIDSVLLSDTGEQTLVGIL